VSGRHLEELPPRESCAPALEHLPTDLHDVIMARRSSRRYRPVEVSHEVVASLLDLARHAPSSMDGQPWHFIVVRDPAQKTRLAEIKNRYCPPLKQRFRADFLVDAPVIVVVCVDAERSFGRHVEDGVLAAFSILLGATRYGLAGVYLSATAADEPRLAVEIRELFRIPGSVLPIAVIPLGYPDGEADSKPLRPLQDMIHNDRFDSSGS
jgi:nitroreductase